jgi:hypothetical protein
MVLPFPARWAGFSSQAAQGPFLSCQKAHASVTLLTLLYCLRLYEARLRKLALPSSRLEGSQIFL